MTAISMPAAAVIIIAVLWWRGGTGRVGLVLAVLAGAALAGLDPVARGVYDAASMVTSVAVDVGRVAAQSDWSIEGGAG